MYKFLVPLYAAIFCSSLLFSQQYSRPSCMYSEHVAALVADNPQVAIEMDMVDTIVARQLKEPSGKSAPIIVIPVVVHVIYRTTDQNISDAQIKSQIKVLNQDFNRLNADQLKTPGPFLGVASNCQIEFCLAQIDPDGMPTTGITRTLTTIEKIGQLGGSAYYNTSQGGHDIWDRDSYLNIWVCEMADQVLGFASPPSLGSLKDKDGVVIGYQYFGTTGNVISPNDKGRTTTHEVGHWLGLEHLWGKGDSGGSNCGIDDGISDTPNQEKANYYCPNFPSVSCSGNADGDMFMNYMDYVDDNCMNVFTLGQKDRMHAILNSIPRISLKSSIAGCSYTGLQEKAGDIQVKIFPNPSNGDFALQTPVIEGKMSVSIYNTLGSLIYQEKWMASEGPKKFNLTLSRGIYTMVVYSEKGISQNKLLINH